MRLEKKQGYNPSLSFSLQFNFSVHPHGKSKFARLGLPPPGRFPALSNIFLHRVDDELKEGKKLANYFPDRVNKRNVKSYVEARPVIFPGLGLFCLERELLIR